MCVSLLVHVHVRALSLSLSKVCIFAHFLNSVKLEKYGTFDDVYIVIYVYVMSACRQFTDKTFCICIHIIWLFVYTSKCRDEHAQLNMHNKSAKV